MQQYQVPQFIDVEDKIFGPLTTKQFFYLLGGGGLAFLLWFFLQFWLFILLGAPVITLAVMLAFVKVNGRPFIDTVANYLNYIAKPRLFLWKQLPKKTASPIAIAAKNVSLTVPKSNTSRLNDLAWSLDIKEKIQR